MICSYENCIFGARVYHGISECTLIFWAVLLCQQLEVEFPSFKMCKRKFTQLRTKSTTTPARLASQGIPGSPITLPWVVLRRASISEEAWDCLPRCRSCYELYSQNPWQWPCIPGHHKSSQAKFRRMVWLSTYQRRWLRTTVPLYWREWTMTRFFVFHEHLSAP